MKIVCVASLNPGEGKTTIIAGMASYLQRQSKKVGYIKPVSLKSEDGSDGLFFQSFLKLKDRLDILCPLHATPGEIKELGKRDLPESIFSAFTQVSADKDVVFVEGLSGLSSSLPEGAINSRTASKIGAEVIAVAGYSAEKVEEVINQAQSNFGRSFKGIIFNSMLPGQIEAFKEARPAVLKDPEKRILGLIPQDRALASISLGDLAKGLEAKPLNAFDGTEELVENVMAGSHGIDPGLYYYGQKDKKVVVARSDRPDMQIAALRTPILALFLTGESKPFHEALFQAEMTKVPVFFMPGKTVDVVEKMGNVIKQGPFRQIKKVERIEKLLSENVDLRVLSF